MKKRGQFYLLSAIVIIAIIIGFSAVSTYTKKSDTTRIFDLGEELDIESANVLDYGTYPSNSPKITDAGGLDNFIKKFVEDYTEYIGDDKELTFVFGNPEDSEAKILTPEERESTIRDVSTQTTIWREVVEETKDIEEEEGERIVTVVFKDQTYKIRLKPGENFFFVISQDVGDERHVAKSKDLE